MQCLFCFSESIDDSYMPSTLYNGKRFDYKQCKSCNLIFIHPRPNEEDLDLMYPTSYQNGVDHTILDDPDKKLIGLRFSYGYQFNILRSLNFNGTMLDYGCGNGNFIVNSNRNHFQCDGAEYNSDHVEILKKEITESNFYSIPELIEGDKTYDLIRLSNVFEHFTKPKDEILQIKNKLNPGGYLLIEGPIEYNFSIALQFRKMYFRLRKMLNKKYMASHTPTHIIFTNSKNQLDLFKNLGLKQIHWKTSEAEWPFPPSLKAAKGMVSKLNFIIARISILIQKYNKNWGNTFIYVGQNK